MRNAVIAAALVLSAATASAQPAMTAPMTPMEPTQAKIAEVKSESTATLLAIGATLGGLALASAGAEHGEGSVMFGGIALTLIGPSAGHFYAGENGHGAKMTLLRTGGLLIMGVGIMESTMAADCDVGGDCGTGDSRASGEKLLWLGGGILVGATIYDLWDARSAARRANEKAARTWTVSPSIMAGASGSRIPALTLGGSF